MSLIVRDLYIEIKKEAKAAAAVCFNEKGQATSALKKVISILNNYNRVLSQTKLEDKPFAIRVLQEENEEGTRNDMKLDFTIQSKRYLENEYPDFKYHNDGDLVANPNDKGSGLLLVWNSDINFYYSHIAQKVTIDFDDCSVLFSRIFYLEEACEYERWKGRNVDRLKTWEGSFNKIPFNRMQEFCDFVLDNQAGFMSDLVDQVVLPIMDEVVDPYEENQDPDEYREFV